MWKEERKRKKIDMRHCVEGKKVGIKSSEFWKRADNENALTYYPIQLIPKLFVPEETLYNYWHLACIFWRTLCPQTVGPL